MPINLNGIIPVMITPFTDENALDPDSLHALVEWYIEHDANALFAVCQSSEMQKLTLKERTELSKLTIRFANDRVPVIASGHISTGIDDQIAELSAMADTGTEVLVLVTNRLDPENEGTDVFKHRLNLLLDSLPKDLPLGLYECPAPYRRLLTDDELQLCRDTGRFVVLKDVCCDLERLKRRIALVDGSPLSIINANAAIAGDAMRSGSRGFCGVFTNFHPDLYAWLYANLESNHTFAPDLEVFLAMSAMAEGMGYPKLAKLYLQRLGILKSAQSRVVDYDPFQRHWASEKLLDLIHAGTERFRSKTKMC